MVGGSERILQNSVGSWVVRPVNMNLMSSKVGKSWSERR